jgi:hypothetical protein
MRGSGGVNPLPFQATIVLPTLNEEEGLARTLDELPLDHLFLAGFRTRVLVVDGGSTDRTVEVAQRRGATVVQQTGRGKGDAVRQGLAMAIDQGSDFVTVIDADYSYVAETLLPVCSLLAAGTDLVIGARRPLYDPTETLRALAHRVGDALLSLTAARLSRVPFLDICSGLWGVRADAMRQVTLESDGFEIEAELFLKMARHGFRVSQVPVTYRPRIGIAKLRALKDGSRIFLTILRYSRSSALAGGSVDLQYLPEDASPVGMRASLEWLRVVQAVCFSVNPPRLSIVAAPERAEEARELADRLWAGKIQVSLTVSSHSLPARPAGEETTVDPTPTVRLPALLNVPSLPAMAIVRIPQCRAQLTVPQEAVPTPENPVVHRSGGYRLRWSRESPPSFITNLATALHDSPQRRSDALLHATAGHLGLRSERLHPGAQVPASLPESPAVHPLPEES